MEFYNFLRLSRAATAIQHVNPLAEQNLTLKNKDTGL